MNREHLKTYIWLRWRLSANQIRRSGAIGAIIAAVLAGLRILGGAITFIAGLLIGLLALGQAEPKVLLFIWDGVAGGFILFWLAGLMSELQRSELLSLDNFMQLPVSPSGAFLINYVGSSFGLSLILFLPAMIGLSVGLTFSRGPEMLLLFPMVAAFFLMVTAVTHQFRGWLASMMANPRRRRAIIAVVSLVFILIFQLPNLVTRVGVRGQEQAAREAAGKITELKDRFDNGQISLGEYNQQIAAIQEARNSENKLKSQRIEETVRIVSMAAPPGWLPYGVFAAEQGRFLPVLACFFGMALIGIGSLRRSYRTTLRLYTGDFTKGGAKSKVQTKTISQDAPDITAGSIRSNAFLEKRLPWLSEQASAITLMNFRFLMRAPEVKLALLTPLILLIVFGGMFLGKGSNLSGLLRPLAALGFVAFILVLSMTGFVGNQFAFDRSGFRTFVLSGVPRRDILLGKNISLLPVAVLLMLLIVGIFQWVNPMRWDHMAAVLLQVIPMYLLFCMTANVLAILSPMTLRRGSGMPASHQGKGGLFHLVFMLVVPVPLSLTFVPLGIEALYCWLVAGGGFPVFLALSVIEFPCVVLLYRAAVGRQGGLLQQHEKKILDVVSAKGE